MKRLLISVSVLAPIAALGFYFLKMSDEAVYKISDYLTSTSTQEVIKKIENKVSALPPIFSEKDYPKSNLSVEGILNWTNKQRKINGSLPLLSKNSRLNQIAFLRIKDMFAKEYFEHNSPQGIGASDIAHDVGYEFILVGENIALGNFDGDEALVQAWMDSPGHRANILNNRYTEIGIAAEKGLYKGKSVWLAVQVFGRPLYLCKQPDYALKKIINERESKIDLLNIEAKAYYFEIQEMKNAGIRNANEYNKKVAAYNEIIKEINSLVAEIKSMIEKYNSQVKIFNACVQN